MLDRLDLQFFKCFQQLKLPLRPLTLLSGSNASGKSSVLQTLVLVHQTIREHEWSTRLMLNGDAIQLGTVQDIVDKLHGRRSFSIGVSDDAVNVHWWFQGDRDEMSLAVTKVRVNGTAIAKPEQLHHLLPPDAPQPAQAVVQRLRNLHYITAERVGPRQVYPLEDPQVAPIVGPRGEHTASVLFRGLQDRVREELLLPGVAPTRFHQVTARMRQFFPGFGLNVQPVPQANAVTLAFRTSDDTDFHRPSHVGFGLTQVLPLVVSTLSAAPNDLLLIENPEVHLHPAGQAHIGYFLAEAAASGLQVILETHSDHVLNGIRRAVRDTILAPEAVALHFFSPRVPDKDQVTSPTLDASGNVDVWPDGFFDQFDKDMNYFAGWSA